MRNDILKTPIKSLDTNARKLSDLLTELFVRRLLFLDKNGPHPREAPAGCQCLSHLGKKPQGDSERCILERLSLRLPRA